jgi:hypothetical protein
MNDSPENIRLLNEKLGITERENLFNSEGVKSITEMLESSKRDFEILCGSIASKKEEVESAEKTVKDTIRSIGEKKDGGDVEQLESAALAVSHFNASLDSMVSIIEKGNDIIGALYDAIVSTNIIDPDLLNSAAAVIHSIRETNDNLIQFNIQKMTLEQQYRLAIESEKLKQRNRLELEYFKWELRQKELENKSRIKIEEEEKKNSMKAEVVNVSDGEGGRMWSQKEMAEILRKSKEGDNA